MEIAGDVGPFTPKWSTDKSLEEVLGMRYLLLLILLLVGCSVYVPAEGAGSSSMQVKSVTTEWTAADTAGMHVGEGQSGTPKVLVGSVSDDKVLWPVAVFVRSTAAVEVEEPKKGSWWCFGWPVAGSASEDPCIGESGISWSYVEGAQFVVMGSHAGEDLYVNPRYWWAGYVPVGEDFVMWTDFTPSAGVPLRVTVHYLELPAP
jgi:hypothetical protein